ncbi:MAG: hypothetical protein IPP90_22605 [Gemmatimonadaceae bacterium]|nr:hypothetical protein [Gemmatimonadaceae bacterium]
MPQIDFDAMPDSARVWVFGAAAPVTGAAAEALLTAVDAHLAQWAAHGAPLVCAREWRDDQFLAIAVDEAATGASGCSIDGLFRVLKDLERQLGTSMVDGGTVFWRRPDGCVTGATRSDFRTAARDGLVHDETRVFDTLIDTAGAWREHFERPAATSWHARLLRS